MAHLGPSPTDDDIMRFVEHWVDLLAEGEFEAAFHSTAQDPYYQWTPELIRRVVEGYGLPEIHPSGVTFQVTPRGTASGSPGNCYVERYNDANPPFFEVYYDLPLNGEWSDLTVTFRIDPGGSGCTVTLQEIHVF